MKDKASADDALEGGDRTVTAKTRHGTARRVAPDMEKEKSDLRFIDRLKFGAVSYLGYWVIRAVGATMRWEVRGWSRLESVYAGGRRAILAFWHGRIFMATYFFRHRGIVVMISRNRDGEYIARVIQRFGYGVARGSSSRGGRSAILELLRSLSEGKDAGMAMDGPRGPRYRCKSGAAYVALKSGNPVVPFHISVDRKWVLRSWDHFMIPHPFSRALVSIGAPIEFPANLSAQEMELLERRIEDALKKLKDEGDAYWGGEPDQ